MSTAVFLASIMTKKLTLILVSIWWGWTVIIDFAVVPAVFRVINDFFNAGELGATLFARLNGLEIIVSSLLIVVTLVHFKINRRGKLQLSLVLAAWAIVMVYVAYLTPKITSLTYLWKEAEALGQSGLGDINDIQQEHQFFHNMYVTLDSIKLLILTFLLGRETFAKT